MLRKKKESGLGTTEPQKKSVKNLTPFTHVSKRLKMPLLKSKENQIQNLKNMHKWTRVNLLT